MTCLGHKEGAVSIRIYPPTSKKSRMEMKARELKIIEHAKMSGDGCWMHVSPLDVDVVVLMDHVQSTLVHTCANIGFSSNSHKDSQLSDRAISSKLIQSRMSIHGK